MKKTLARCRTFTLAVLAAALSLAGTAQAQVLTYDTRRCDVPFTDEQARLIGTAWALGDPKDFGTTLAAITWQESFVGDQVVRTNPTDGRMGSYGVTHVQLTTAAWMLDERPTRRIRNELMTDDQYALTFALSYLVHTESIAKKARLYGNQRWRATVVSYNGKGDAAREYADNVVAKVRYLNACGVDMKSKRIEKPLVAKAGSKKQADLEKLQAALSAKPSRKVKAPTEVASKSKTKSRAAIPTTLAPKSSIAVAAPKLTAKAIQERIAEIYAKVVKASKPLAGTETVAWATRLATQHKSDMLSSTFLHATQCLTASCVAAGKKYQADLDFLNLMILTKVSGGVSIAFNGSEIIGVYADQDYAIGLLDNGQATRLVHHIISA